MTEHARQRLPSERSFGLVFTGVFALFGLWPAVVHSASPRWWALIVALGFAVCAAFWPHGLRPLNFVWYKIGMALHHVVNPLLMGLIYFGAVVPMGLIMQFRGRDPLRVKRDPKIDSYWIRRLPPLPAATLSKQF
ncbi:hypothetical protein [Bradyrhizobium lupini]